MSISPQEDKGGGRDRAGWVCGGFDFLAPAQDFQLRVVEAEIAYQVGADYRGAGLGAH